VFLAGVVVILGSQYGWWSALQLDSRQHLVKI
ncbi:MAG: hypothetical protein ACI9FD_005060, partial [Gammaproteobacteria bacterium]